MTDLDDDYTTELADNSDKGSDLSTDEDVIELTDIVKDETTNPDLEVEKEDEFDFELSDSKDAEQIDDEFTDVELEDVELEDVELEDVELEDVELEDDAADFTVDKPETEPGLERAAPDDFNIDQEQIETILERIIEKKFAGKIESILFEVMENVIEKQIVEIKERLQKEL